MIITVTLNPAIDKTIKVNSLKLGEVNRTSMVQQDAGGKGINVSKMVKNLGGESIATGVIAGNSGMFIKKQLDSFNIENDFVEIEGNTRTNIKLVDTANEIHTDINEVGADISYNSFIQFEKLLFSKLKPKDILVLCGSVPPNIDKTVYEKWITMANKKQITTILDADGKLLKNGIKAIPSIVKPNIHELERYYDEKINSIDEVIQVAKKLLKCGIELVVVSMGEEGSVFVAKDKIIIAKAEDVNVKSTVGAGDSMVGALAYAMSMNMNLMESAYLSVASATASVTNDGTQMGSLEQVQYWKKNIEIKEYVK